MWPAPTILTVVVGVSLMLMGGISASGHAASLTRNTTDTSSGGGVGLVVWWRIVGLSINTLVLVGFRSATKLGRLFWWGGAGGLLFVN
ncbi:hypothetical protein QJS66_09410 [Kocuria rhizophila]|nr:hypothetical protein QJS66_09410 [Kocuria rhizophila]